LTPRETRQLGDINQLQSTKLSQLILQFTETRNTTLINSSPQVSR